MALLLTTTAPPAVEAQIGGIGKKIKRAAEKKVDEAERDADKAVDDAIACVVGDKKCVEDAEAQGKPVKIVDAEGKEVDPAASGAMDAPTEAPGTGRWTNYDFLRGERPIYNSRWNIEDIDDPPAMKPNPAIRVGRIPPNITFGKGTMQITQIDGENVLEFSANTWFRIELDEPLSADFSLELDVQTAAPNTFIYVYFGPFTDQQISYSNYEHHYLSLWRGAGIYHGREAISSANALWSIAEELTPIKFQVDDGYAILYAGEERAAQIPNFGHPGGSKVIEVYVTANDRRHAFIRDIRVDYGLDDPYDAFMAEKAYTTRSIYFDFNSATLRPESTPELERIRRMLDAHRDIAKVVIEGHTDGIGADDYNQQLSARRAEEVKAYLVDKGIAADRVDTVGKGESEPIGDNATDDGRQMNRRVVVRGR